MTERTLVGKILDNTPSSSMTKTQPNVTGRDAQMAHEALIVALPIALRYSLPICFIECLRIVETY